MKKMIATVVAAGFISIASYAQPTIEKPQVSKEEKAKMKAKQEEELIAAMKEAGLNDDQVKKVKEIMAEANDKSRPIKTDATLSETARTEKLKEISDEKNEKIKALLGKDMAKKLSTIRKRMKEEAEAKGGN